MAEQLDLKELVSFKELLMSEVIQSDALINLLDRKGRQMAEMEDRWLSVEEISKYLGVSSDTVYRWIESRRIVIVTTMSLIRQQTTSVISCQNETN